MAQLVLAVAGAAVLGPLGLGLVSAGTGFAVGGALAGVLFPPEQPKPAIADLTAPKGSYGSVIPYVEGAIRLPYIVAWESKRRAIETTSGGKGGLGGPEQTSISYVCDVLFIFGEQDLGSIRRVWVNKNLKFSRAAALTDEATAEMNAEPPWSSMTNYPGLAGQLPDPTYAAVIGEDFASAYRGRHTVFFQDLQLGGSTQLSLIEIEFTGIGNEAGDGSTLVFFPDYVDDSQDSIDVPANYVIVQDGSPVTDDLSSYPSLGFDLVGDNFLKLTSVFPSNPFIRYDVQKLINGTQPPPADYVVNYFVAVKNVEGNTGEFVANGDVFPVVNFQDALSGANGIGIGLRRESALNRLYVVNRFSGGSSSSTLIQDIGALDVLWFRLEQTFVDGFTNSSNLYLRMSEEIEDETLLVTRTMAQARYIFVGDSSIQPIPSGSPSPGITRADVGKLKAYLGLPGQGVNLPLQAPSLQEVVERQCARAGIAAEYVDATELASKSVRGMAVSQVTSPRNVLDTLSAAYLFTSVESDVLRFQFLGGDSVATIPWDELGASLDTPATDRLPITKGNDIEQVVQVFVNYINADDDYQQGMEPSDRLISSSKNTSTTEVPLVFSPTEAKQLAEVNLLRGVVEGTRFGPFSVNRDYAALEPGDVVLVFDQDGNQFRVRLTQKTEAQGVLTFEAVLDDATVYNSAAVTSGNYSSTVLVVPRLPTDAYYLDINLLRDDDDYAGIYLTTTHDGPFPGAALLSSPDDVTYTRFGETAKNADIGFVVGGSDTVNGGLGTWTGGNLFDEANWVDVEMVRGQLYSYTRDEVLNQGKGAYYLGTGNLAAFTVDIDRVKKEIIQARTATLIAPNTYRLSGLLRGRMGTESSYTGGENASLTGDLLAVLDPAKITRITLQASEIDTAKYYKAVTFGRAESTADSDLVAFKSVSKRPWSPTNPRFHREDDDIHLAWSRRTRRSTNFLAGINPLGEETELYRVIPTNPTFTSTFGGATFTTTTPELVLTAAMQMAINSGMLLGSSPAFIVQQMSGEAGPGYPLKFKIVDNGLVQVS